nr:hypothetical protein [Mucilaginibacter sp. X5P1]
MLLIVVINKKSVVYVRIQIKIGFKINLEYAASRTIPEGERDFPELWVMNS